MSPQQKMEPPSAVERIANFTAAARTERLTPEVRRLFKRNILDGKAIVSLAVSQDPAAAVKIHHHRQDLAAPAGRTIRIGTDPVGLTGKVMSSTCALGLPTGIDCARVRTARASAGDKV